MSWIKNLFQILIVTIILVIGIEVFILYILNYKVVISGNTTCRQYISENDFSVYKPNCELYHKHWEQDIGIEYTINSFGRRDGSQSTGEQLIAFIGDSFTFGAMVDINDNYNYRSLHYLENKKLGGHNFGVAAENFHNIFNKLNKQDFSSYKYIIYGFTPNDLFDLVDGSSIKDGTVSIVKKLLLSTATSKFLLHNLMRLDKVYLDLYLSRQPYAGYLESPLSGKYENAIDIAFSQLSELENNIKRKLIIVLLPQRAEVVAMRLGLYKNDFQEYFIKSCKSSGLNCFLTDVGPLSKIDESHFPVDGHLTVEGNDIVGRQLGGFLKTLRLN